VKAIARAEDLGAKAHNLEAMTAFCRWCVERRRLAVNPMAGVERLNTAVDIRHQRRALTGEEIAKLVQSARESGVTFERCDGERRARIYILSYMTGLRRKELGSLTARSFDLDGNPPTVTVEAAASKHKKKDVLPLHPDLVIQLRAWLSALKPGEKLFPGLETKKNMVYGQDGFGASRDRLQE
jgi:integrase